jgi:hypothetical protein
VKSFGGVHSGTPFSPPIILSFSFFFSRGKVYFGLEGCIFLSSLHPVGS